MEQGQKRFAGKTVAVFGGAGDLGFDLALQAGKEGGRIAILDNREDRLSSAVKKLNEAGVDNVTPHALDIRDESSVRSSIAQILKAHRSLDVVVNTAGIVHGKASKGKTGWEAPIEDFELVMAINFTGAVCITQAAMAEMVKTGKGRILHYTSIGGREGNPMMSPYAASKSALIGYVKAVGKEIASRNTQNGWNIAVNALAPCTVDGEMIKTQCTQQEVDYMKGKIPAARLIAVNEVTEIALSTVALSTPAQNGQIIDATLGRWSV